MAKISFKFSPKKVLRNIGKALFTATLIPYAIATYSELKTVAWMNYWQVLKVTLFVVAFSVFMASFVYGIDQIVSRLFDAITKVGV